MGEGELSEVMNPVRYEITGVKLDGQLLSGVESFTDCYSRNPCQSIAEVKLFDGTTITRSGYLEFLPDKKGVLVGGFEVMLGPPISI